MRPAGLFLRDQGSPGSFLRRKGGAAMAYYQYCMVQFREKGAAYAYLTGGLPLKVGDWVELPFGKDDVLRRGQVKAVMFNPNPPLDKSPNRFRGSLHPTKSCTTREDFYL